MTDRPRWSSDRPKASETKEAKENRGEGQGSRKPRTPEGEEERQKAGRARDIALATIRRRPF